MTSMLVARLVAVLLLITVSLAGCTGNGDKGEDGSDGDGSGTSTGTSTSSGSKSKTSTGTSSGTGTGGPGPGNDAPTASLAASVANGSVPLNVTFTATVTDPDGDNLTWQLDFGDGSSAAQGTSSGQANHTFTSAGNYTAVLTVSDGQRNASANLTIVVAAGGGSANSFIVTLTDICAPPTTTCTRAPNGCPDFARRTPGAFCAWFPIPAELRGKAFTLTSTSGDPDATFSASPAGACAFPANEASRVVFDEEGPEAGTIPATSPTGGFTIDCVTLIEFEAKPSTITFSWTP